MFLHSSKMCISFISLHNVHTTSSFLKNEHTISFASCGVYQIHQCAYQFINSFKMCIQVLSFLQNVHTSSFIPLKYANQSFLQCKQNMHSMSFINAKCVYQVFLYSKMCLPVFPKCAYQFFH